MKKVFFFLIGAVVGVAACFVVLYVSGAMFESFGLRFYESEADQQRNFNLFLIVSAVIGLASGYFVARKFA